MKKEKEQKEDHGVEVAAGHFKISLKNLPPKVQILLAGAAFVIALALAYSLIKGWSTINIKVEKAMEVVEEKIEETEEKP